MGTSISHPSPSGVSYAGKQWREVKEAITDGISTQQVVTKTIEAFSEQYGEEAVSKIVDQGVELVATTLNEVASQLRLSDEGKVGSLMAEARRNLALNQCNSFFSELALTAASEAILSGELYKKEFAILYASKVIDYVVSRDLPSILGSIGITNLTSLNRFESNVRSEFSTRIGATVNDPIQTLKSIFLSTRESTNE